MAVYTDISDTELEIFLADFDLGAPLSFKGIAEGVENSNFLLETSAGRFILTVYERRIRREDLPFFVDLMRCLAGRGYPCPAPIGDRDGRFLKSLRGKPAAVIAFMPGLSVRAPSPDHCRQAGDGLAWLHQAAEGFPGRRRNDLGEGAWRAMFAPLAGAADTLKAGLASTIEDDLALFARTWPKGLPRGVIHADYFPDNVFFQGGRFAAAIDFYFAAWDALAYDIGVALNAWCFDADGVFSAANAKGLVDGYQRRRPLSEREMAALPILAHGAAMRFFLTRLAAWGATPTGALVRRKDPLEYERRLSAHRAGLDILGRGEA